MLDYYLFKQVYDLFLRGDAEEAKSVLSELQEKYIEISDENAFLKTQVQEFEDILYLAKNLEYDGHSYWLKTGTIKQGPFCRNCFDNNGLLIRLNEIDDAWKCLTCGTRYGRGSNGVVPPRPTKAASAKIDSGKVIQLYK